MPKIKRGKNSHPNQPVLSPAKKPVTYRIILQVYDIPINEDNQRNRYSLHVIAWNNLPPQLEKRRTYLSPKEGSSLRMYKQAGMTIDDIRIISEHQEEIVKALQD